MEAKIGKFFESVTNFFSASDHLPWCDSDIVGIEPDWRQAQSLHKTIEDHITKDGVIGIGIADTIAGGIAAAVTRKN